MTFCHIFEVASRIRQTVINHRSLTIEKCSVQEKKVVVDKRSLMAGSLMTGSTVLQIRQLTVFHVIKIQFFELMN